MARGGHGSIEDRMAGGGTSPTCWKFTKKEEKTRTQKRTNEPTTSEQSHGNSINREKMLKKRTYYHKKKKGQGCRSSILAQERGEKGGRPDRAIACKAQNPVWGEYRTKKGENIGWKYLGT